MKKNKSRLLKSFYIISGMLVIIIILSVLIFYLFLDPRQFKPAIEKMLFNMTGTHVTMGDDLDLFLFPWVGISVSNVRVDNPQGFAEKEMLKVKSLKVKARLLSLLHGDLQVKQFVLEDPRLVLERNRDDKLNFKEIAISALGKDLKVETENNESRSYLFLKTFDIKKVSVTNGSVVWIDHIKGERRELKDITLRVNDISAGKPIPIKLSGNYNARSVVLEGTIGPLDIELVTRHIPLNFSARVLNRFYLTVQGEIKNSGAGSKVRLAFQVPAFSPRDFFSEIGLEFPFKTGDPQAFNRVAFKAELEGICQKQLRFSGEIEIDNVRLLYKVEANDMTRPDLSFDLVFDMIDLNRFLPEKRANDTGEKKINSKALTLSGEGKADLAWLREVRFNGSIKADRFRFKNLILEDTIIRLSGKDGEIDLELLETACPMVSVEKINSESRVEPGPLAKVSIHGSVTNLITHPQYNLAFHATPFSPKKLFSCLGIEFPFKTTDPNALSSLGFSAEFKGDIREKLNASGIMRIDGSNISYTAVLKNMEKPDLAFNLELDRIDLDRLLPPDNKGKPSDHLIQKKSNYDRGINKEKSILHQSTFNGRLKVGQIKIKNLLLNNLSASVSGSNGKITLNLENMTSYGARAKGVFATDLSKAFPEVKIHSKVNKISIERFVKALNVKGGQQIEGILDLASDAIIVIKNGDELKKSISGNISINSKRLLLHQIDLDNVLKKYEKSQSFGFLDLGSYFVLGPFGPLLTKAYDHASTIRSLGKGKSVITHLVSDWKIKEGIASAEDVAFSTAKNRVAVKGKIDIQKQTFDNLKIAIVDQEGCVKFVQTVNGDFSKPEIEKTSFVVKSIVRPIVSIVKKSKDFITRSKCEVFYSGKVAHPLKK